LKTQQDYKGKNNMNKKAQVKMLLDMVSNIKSIPTTDEHSIDMKRFYQVPEIKAIITLLKLLKVNADYLSKNGFIVAHMLLASELKDNYYVEYDCKHCGEHNKHYYYGSDTHFCIGCGAIKKIK
jgi:lipopolysaccharide biosynthesis regulator YciM